MKSVSSVLVVTLSFVVIVFKAFTSVTASLQDRIQSTDKQEMKVTNKERNVKKGERKKCYNDSQKRKKERKEIMLCILMSKQVLVEIIFSLFYYLFHLKEVKHLKIDF